MKPNTNYLKYLLASILPLVIISALALAAPPASTMAMADTTAAAGVYSQIPAGESGAGSTTGETPATGTAAGTDTKSTQSQLGVSTNAITAEAPDTNGPTVFNQDPAGGAITGPMKVLGYDFSDPSGVLWPDAVHLYVDGTCSRSLPGTTDITATGLRYAPSVPLSDGNHNLRAMVCDNLLNCRMVNWSFKVDAYAPVAVPAAPTGTVNTSTVSIGADLNDPVYGGGTASGINTAGVKVSLDGGNITPNCLITAGSLSCPSGYLPDGDHTVSINVLDNAGNHGSATWDFHVDTAAIGITGQKPVPFSWLMTGTPLISADFQQVGANPIDTGSVRLTIDGDDVTSLASVSVTGLEYMPSDRLDEGDHTVQIEAADGAGHTGLSSWHFLVDTSAPSIDNIDPTGTTQSGRPTISATVSDAGNGIDPAFVRILVDGVDRSISALQGNTITYTPDEDLAAGSHVVEVAAMDYAGNTGTRSWSFTVPPAPPNPARPVILPTENSLSGLIEFWQDYSPIYFATSSPGNWNIAGFVSSPNSYFLPWLDSKGDVPGRRTEIVMTNKGGGEAFVSLFVAGQDMWHGSLAEGEQVIRQLADISDGPVKVVCPTGQPLDVSLRMTSGAGSIKIPATAMDDLEPVWLLPWYEPRPGEGAGTSTIAIANAGDAEAAVDVYMGDQPGPDSLQGHYQIKAGTAIRTELKDAGGVVRVESTNNQPILVSEISSVGDSIAFLPGTGLSRLDGHFEFKGDASSGDDTRGWLLLGNGSEEDARVRIFSGGQELDDEDNPQNDHFLLKKGEARVIMLPDPGADVKVECASCAFGQGLVTARRTISGSTISDMTAG